MSARASPALSEAASRLATCALLLSAWASFVLIAVAPLRRALMLLARGFSVLSRGAAGDTRSRPLATVAICACSSRYADLTSAKGIVETTFHFVTVSIYALARGGLGTGHTLPACRRYLIFVDGLEETMFYGRDRHVPWRACLFFYAHLC